MSGTNKKRTNDIKGKMIGSKVRPIQESLVIEGKKNYDELIKAIEMLEI